MVNFDRTDSAFIQDEIRNFVEEPRTGKVLKVFEHLEDTDTSNFEADVKVDGGERLERLAPVITPSSDSIDVPKVGDTVMVQYLAGESDPPVITGYASTTTDRPPLGKSGMTRKQFDSDSSMMGEGDVFKTEYVKYDKDPADKNKNDLNPEEVFIQIAKRADDVPDPSEESSVPAKVEFYDAPGKGEGHVIVRFENVGGSSADANWGIKFDVATGTWQIVGPSGFGIKSDGSGNFVWHHKDIEFNEPSGPTGPLSL